VLELGWKERASIAKGAHVNQWAWNMAMTYGAGVGECSVG